MWDIIFFCTFLLFLFAAVFLEPKPKKKKRSSIDWDFFDGDGGSDGGSD